MRSSYYVIKTAFPIFFGYIPLGFACGVISQKAGFSHLEVMLLSTFVFAGSGQFIAASMFGAGASIFSIILTTFIINLRHLMMSSALSVHIKNQTTKFLSLFAYEITDETFAINLNEFSKGDWNHKNAIMLNHISHFSWVLNNVLGSIFGEIIPPNAYGMSFVLTAMFIGLLILQFKNSLFLIAAILSGVLSILFSMLFEGNAYIILSSLSATTIIYFVNGKINKAPMTES